MLVWRATKDDTMTLKVPPNCRGIWEYYDEVQENISKISVLDELLAGKCKIMPHVCPVSGSHLEGGDGGRGGSSSPLTDQLPP